jgi:hypothetical protein
LVELLSDELAVEGREDAIIEVLRTGHWAVCLPEPLREEITSTAHWNRRSRRDVIVERLTATTEEAARHNALLPETAKAARADLKARLQALRLCEPEGLAAARSDTVAAARYLIIKSDLPERPKGRSLFCPHTPSMRPVSRQGSRARFGRYRRCGTGPVAATPEPAGRRCSAAGRAVRIANGGSIFSSTAISR